jgi:hypothetical protein
VETLSPAPLETDEPPTGAPNGRALVIADASAAEALQSALGLVGYEPEFMDDPYQAMSELAQRPLAFRALVMSLAALHPHELAMIEVVKRRYPQVEVFVADAAGRSASLSEAVRLGADAVLEEQRLRRFPGPSPAEVPDQAPSPGLGPPSGEPVLTNEELRALLEE